MSDQNPLDEIEQKILEYQQRLNVTARDTSPLEWANLRFELAEAYCERKQGETAENLEQGLNLYQETLEVYTRADMPTEWANTQNRLGNTFLDRVQGAHTENVEKAIYHYQLALEVRTKEKMPIEWAAVQYNLGNVYRYYKFGERAENLEQAVFHYKKALEAYTREAFPKDWADTQYYLGLLYGYRIQGERAEYLEQAIFYYKQSLEVFNRENFPIDWAASHYSLGWAYGERIQGERAENLEQAIFHYQQALEVRTRKALPADWAATQNNLGNAYSNRIRGERVENLEQAIFHYQQALVVYIREALPIDWAMTQNNLGIAYNDRIQGERAENLEKSIYHYQQALEVRTREAMPFEWAQINHNLGVAYKEYAQGESAESIEKSILCFQRALEIRTKETSPEGWAESHLQIGLTYVERSEGDPSDNKEQIISHFSRALEYFTPKNALLKWKTLHYLLGIIYPERDLGEPAENVEKIIYHLEQALTAYSKEDEADTWAGIHFHLGKNYLDRTNGDDAENIEKALRHFEDALQVYKIEDSPNEWADVQFKYARAYDNRINGEEGDNIEQAIFRYKEALKVFTNDETPLDWAACHYYLGNLYDERAEGERAENIELAVLHFQQTLLVYLQENYPKDWAESHLKLGWMYGNRISGEKSDNIEQSTQHYRQTLEIYTFEDYPEEWANSHINLATAYTTLSEMDNPKESIKQANFHFEQALKYFTYISFPETWAQINFAIGCLLLSDLSVDGEVKKIEQAINCFQHAHEVYTRADFPNHWSVIQNNLGNAYLTYDPKINPEKIDQAILCYQLALETHFQKPYTLKWALIQSNLGLAYLIRPQGHTSENIELAIFHLQLGIKYYSQSNRASNLGIIQNYLGLAYFKRTRKDKSKNLEYALYYCELAVGNLTSESLFLEAAKAKKNLGAIYAERIVGERADNIEEAIKYCQEAMKTLTQETAYSEWIDLNQLTGELFGVRIKGDRSLNEKKGLQLLFSTTQALLNRFPKPPTDRPFIDFLDFEENDEDVDILKFNIKDKDYVDISTQKTNQSLPNLVSEWLLSDKKQKAYLFDLYPELRSDESLKIIERTMAKARKENPELADYIESHRNFILEYRNKEEDIEGLSLHEFIQKAEQLGIDINQLLLILSEVRSLPETAENAPKINQLCQDILNTLRERDAWPLIWATMHLTIAKSYNGFEHFTKSTPTNYRDKAIFHFQEALEVFSPNYQFDEWRATKLYLGTSLQSLSLHSSTPDKSRDVAEREIRQALEVSDEIHFAFPKEGNTWGHAQLFLADSSYNKNKTEQAISYAHAALTELDQNSIPELWGNLHLLLGNAYHAHTQGDYSENAEKAISHYLQTLEVWSCDKNPSGWAEVQHALGIAYSDRVRGERSDNLEKSIFHFSKALEVYNREDSPVKFSITKANLGGIYQDHIYPDYSTNLEKSIFHLNEALEVTSQLGSPAPGLMSVILNYLGNSYKHRLEGSKAQNLEKSISLLEQAINIYNRADSPIDWANSANNLALVIFLSVEEAIKNKDAQLVMQRVKDSISYLHQVLDIYTRNEMPRHWALAQNNLGALLHYGNYFTQSEDGFTQAIIHYKNALEIYTPSSLPNDARKTSLSLGRLLYEQKRYLDARHIFIVTHESVEVLRSEMLRESSKRELASDNAEMYAKLVYCCLMGNDVQAALEYAFAAKSRLFMDRLVSTRLDLSVAGADDPAFAGDLQKARELRQQIDNLLTILTNAGGTHDNERGGEVHTQISVEAEKLQKQEVELWRELERKYPALTATQKAPAVTAADAINLAGELDATIVEYYQHAEGWCAFVITAHGVSVHELEEMDDEFAKFMLRWMTRWESPAGQGEFSYKCLKRLHRILIAPLPLQAVPNRLILAPFGSLHLLPLAAALDESTNRYLAQDYMLAFAPTAAALHTVRRQIEISAMHPHEHSRERLLSVAYSGTAESKHYLPNVLPEAQAIAGHFPDVTSLYGDHATPDAVIAHARGKQVAHFGCHGLFDTSHPQESGLILANGWLTIQRIITELKLNETEIATMGACLSGKLDITRGDELMGLTQAMLTAGTKSVVGSLWSVNDLSTRALFESFYSRATAGEAPATAMQHAMQAVREQPAWKHPYYWAAFVVSGLAYNSAPERTVSPPAIDKIHEEHQTQNARRGGTLMSVEENLRDAEVLLEVMSDEPEGVLSALSEAERTELLANLERYSAQAESSRTEADLLVLADNILKLAETSPKLRALLLPANVDWKEAQNQRAITLKTHKSSEKSDHAQKKAAQIRNSVITCRDNLLKALKK